DPPRLKVQARLLAAGTQGIVWSQDFQRRRGDSDALANAIAAAVTRAVKGGLTPAESARLTTGRQTSPEADEPFLIGRSRLEGYGGANADGALQAFQRAVQLDPRHAGAHAGAARAYIAKGENGLMPKTEARAAALAEIQESLDYDPDLADAHAVRGYI